MSSLWESWADLTRFLESARIAFVRERILWDSLELGNREDASVKVKVGRGWYKATLNQHVDAMDDMETLFASVLIHSYALMESAAADALGVSRVPPGIETWGNQLLSQAGKDWSDVRDGKSGAVEFAVVRNAFAHATRVVTPSASNRLVSAGAPPRAAGTQVSLSYVELRTYRGRMQHLLNTAGLQRQP